MFHMSWELRQVQKAFAGKDLSRDEKTKLVNDSVVRDEKGNYRFDLEQPVVKQIVSHTAETEGEDRAIGYPRSMMAAKLGGDQKLAEALQSGEVQCVTDRGRQFFMFNTISISKKARATSQVSGEVAAAATPETFSAMAGFVETFNPSFSALAALKVLKLSCPIVRFLLNARMSKYLRWSSV